MRPETAYKQLNKIIWKNNLPSAVVIVIDDPWIPRCNGVTLFDNDFMLPVIFINAGHKRWGKTMVHEMLHVAEPLLEHGAVFETMVNRYWKIAQKKIKGLRNL
jgi:hypothetical protein